VAGRGFPPARLIFWPNFKAQRYLKPPRSDPRVCPGFPSFLPQTPKQKRQTKTTPEPFLCCIWLAVCLKIALGCRQGIVGCRLGKAQVVGKQKIPKQSASRSKRESEPKANVRPKTPKLECWEAE